jgi:hypothetical protein
VGDKHVQLPEGAGVQQPFDPFSGGEPTLGVLAVDPRLPAAQPGLGAHLPEFLDLWINGHPVLLLFSLR